MSDETEISSQDLFYYQYRGEVELEQARLAGHPAAVKAHYELATAYLERADADILPLSPSKLTAEHGLELAQNTND